ncbi:hypothetical protein UFOVP78_9 [uncultured Caudovirales phage]|uniref:Bbp19-like phage domain-containing protein n=1 Tax=uncultured Caudovirales phage TaxID=2100421 RepID=A0A6J5KZD6_9CAUD|nr:hypothetical protein UFOVP78_9 [uncultured Caudovirales phage]
MNAATRLWRRLRERPASREDAAAEEYQRRLDYHITFGTEHGQRVFADLLRRAGLMQSSYTLGDTHETARREGARRFGLELVEIITSDPDAVARMLRSGQVEELFPHE